MSECNCGGCEIDHALDCPSWNNMMGFWNRRIEHNIRRKIYRNNEELRQ
jgi:hypothetical protein